MDYYSNVLSRLKTFREVSQTIGTDNESIGMDKVARKSSDPEPAEPGEIFDVVVLLSVCLSIVLLVLMVKA